MQGNRAAVTYVLAGSWPVAPSDVVDTTGAGDSFIAGFIYGLTHRLGIARCATALLSCDEEEVWVGAGMLH